MIRKARLKNDKVKMIFLAAAILVAHAILLLGPPLLSQDVFGYTAFARLGALHGLDPYTHVAAQASGDEVFAFVGWPYQHSPYGPLFTAVGANEATAQFQPNGLRKPCPAASRPAGYPLSRV